MSCEICGTYTKFKTYRLCRSCYSKNQNDEILLCDDCDTYYLVGENCNCYDKDTFSELEEEISQTYCIICGENSNNKPQCLSCYRETKSYMSDLNKNSDATAMRDHYYNLKDAIFRMNDFNIVKKNCNRLIAIAMLNKIENNDSALESRMYKDASTMIENQKPKEHIVVPQNVSDKDEEKSRLITAEDGHKVESNIEAQIDDMLWNSKIMHSYGAPVTGIHEFRKKSDWFIPITGTTPEEGIYIEYWGMDTPKYLKDREEKEALYIKYKIPFISIEKDDPKQTRDFKNNFLRDLRKKADEHFGFFPKWKK